MRRSIRASAASAVRMRLVRFPCLTLWRYPIAYDRSLDRKHATRCGAGRCERGENSAER